MRNLGTITFNLYTCEVGRAVRVCPIILRRKGSENMILDIVPF